MSLKKVMKISEYKKSDIEKPIKSFKTKKELNPIVWIDEDTINPDIRKDLLAIADDLYEELELTIEYSDIILTGSLANYNWSNYSDFDLHILIDFAKVDDNKELVKKFFDAVKGMWNLKHDIKIHDFDVEVYLQDINEPHTATGVFSLLNNAWKIKPNPFKVEIDENAVRTKSEELMSQIDKLEKEVDELPYEEFMTRAKNVWDKIKKGRAEGLAEGGELGTGNIVFKLLRRNGYVEKIIDLKLEAYDKHHSRK